LPGEQGKKFAIKPRSWIMKFESIIYRKESGMRRISINRPQAMNAITPAMRGELRTAVIEAGEDDEVKVIFDSGFDIDDTETRLAQFRK
jgi:1,4-dihydroxy-2-naphthoyl-CoA synthase